MKKALSNFQKSIGLLKARNHLYRNPSLYTNYFFNQTNLCWRPVHYSFSETKEENFEKSESENLEFKAETRKLLDIVAKSLYTDKEVFLRELISNASDALEKQRFLQISGKDTSLSDTLQISITCNDPKRQIIIQDNGVGMTKEELIENLGTIARSGSREFIQKLGEGGQGTAEGIIGQFGVGFYSSFIVGDTIEVISKTASSPDTHLWVSDGSGKFEISKISNPGFDRGTKIVIHLKPDCAKFAIQEEAKRIIQKYSNFLNFPITLNGEKVNLASAIWTRDRREISAQDYKALWQSVSGSSADYKYKLHFVSEVPLSVKSILFIPNTNLEKFRMSVEDFDINLYSKKVLIKAKARELLPVYLRFVKGVVDCEDIPLNISRENYQDSALIARLRLLLTKRVLRLLDDEGKKDPQSYLMWYQDFQNFLKEGLYSDPDNFDDLVKLARFEASWTKNLVTLDDYIPKMKPGQDSIYFIQAQSRELAESSPYMDSFKGTDIPVLFFGHIDEVIFSRAGQYKNYNLVNVETQQENVKELNTTEPSKVTGLPEEEITNFCLWVKNELKSSVAEVKVSKTLKEAPGVIRSQISATMRSLLKIMEQNMVSPAVNEQLTLEINPNHELVTRLNEIRKSDPEMASVLAQQFHDNLLINAGLLRDTHACARRVDKIMLYAMDKVLSGPAITDKSKSQ